MPWRESEHLRSILGSAERPRVAVLGAGHWGANLVRNFAALGALAAVVDTDADRATRAATEAGAPSVSLAAALADPALDAVAIATPAATHADIALQALQAGKHVFVEKPLALALEDAAKVRSAAIDADRILMVGHLLRYHPAFEALQCLADSGELGSVQYLSSTRLNFGRFRREENTLWSFAPHDISMILAIVGEEPDHVTAVASTHLNERVADVTTTHMTFAGGQGAHAHVSWLHPVKEQRLAVVGDRGMAIFDDGEPWESKLRIYRHRVEWRHGEPLAARAAAEPVLLEPDEPLRAECAHFLDCIERGVRPRTDADEGMRVLSVLRRAQAIIDATTSLPAPRRQAPPAVPSGVHPTVTIDPDVTLGPGVKVWHYSHLLSGSRIGAGSSLGQNVMVGPNVVIGDGCRIQNNVSVYEGVMLEDEVFCGPSMVFTNVRTPRAGWDRRSEFEPTLVRRGASIGANATVLCGVTLGEYCLVAAGAVVTCDVPAHALMAGVPARRVGWVSHAGEPLDENLVCPRTGDGYRMEGDRLVLRA